VELLERYHAKHGKTKEAKRENYYSDIIANAVDLEAGKKLFDTLITCGYVPADITALLDTYMDKVLEKYAKEKERIELN
jgi:hypothetical protein